MLFQDPGGAAASFREFQKRGLYSALQAEGSAILAFSHRDGPRIQGIDAGQDLGGELCRALCRRHGAAMGTVSRAEAVTDRDTGVHMAVARLSPGVLTVFFRRGQPFSEGELSWAKSFLDLYYEKVLLFQDLCRANEYIGRISGGAKGGPQVFLRAFGRFDVFANGRLVDISSAKAKELLALCVDHRGGDVAMEEAIDKLWGDRAYDQRSKNLYRKTVSYLRRLFENLGCPEVFSTARGRCHLNRELVDCDYFRYLSGGPAHFTGEYLSNYPWAEETAAWLTHRQAAQG